MDKSEFFSLLKPKFEEVTPIPDEQWENFLALFTLQSIAKGEEFISINSSAEKVGFIVSGLVRYYLVTPDGGEFNLAFKAEGDFMSSYYAFLSKEPSPVGVQAIEDTTYYSSNYRDVEKMYDAHPCWLRIGKWITEVHYLNKDWRERQFLQFETAGRLLNYKELYPDLFARVPQNQMAMYLGVNPSSLNRLMKKLKDSGEL
jgi:CRP-like cAMP-binding protein